MSKPVSTPLVESRNSVRLVVVSVGMTVIALLTFGGAKAISDAQTRKQATVAGPRD